MDVMRGLGIFAVVVCHQQGLLHNSEYVQCVSLYSVTSLIFLMGITKGMSLNKYTRTNSGISVLRYSFSSMASTVLSYALASIVADLMINQVSDHMYIFSHLICFDALQPFYFIEIFIKLTLWAPVIYFTFLFLRQSTGRVGIRSALCVLVLFCTWIIGYKSIYVCDIFCQSYFFVYSFGILCSMIELPKPNGRTVALSAALLAVGSFLVYKFYFARVAGNMSYSELIDVLDPNLQMNPPNLSVIIYSFGVIFLVYNLSFFVEKNKYLVLPFKLFAVLGRYSLDIFLWHITIQRLLMGIAIDSLWLRRIVYYSGMLGLPVLFRYLYKKARAKAYELKRKAELSVSV